MNEEPHPQVPVGEFTDEEEWQALSAELARLDEFDAKKDIPSDQATRLQLTFTWVRTVKNGAPNFRLCLRPLDRQSERSKESLDCPTPGPQIYELKLALHSDSTATMSQRTKMGLGRMKHVELRFLFVNDLLKRERVTLRKIPGNRESCGSRNQGAVCEHSSTPVLDHWFGPCETGSGGDQR